MPRVNVEDEIESDARFHALTALLGGDSNKALGFLIRFWRMAQKYWGDEKALVPHNLFKCSGYEVLLEVDLAELREGGVYCRGAEAQFDWYLQKCRAGRASVAAREMRKSNGTGVPLERNDHPVTTEPPSRCNGTAIPDQPPSPSPALVTRDSVTISSGNPQGGRQQAVDNAAEAELPGPEPPLPEPHHYGEVVQRQTRSQKFDAVHLQLARWMIKKVNLHAAVPEKLEKADEAAWANELRLTVNDGIELGLLIEMLQWAFDDTFWKTRIESPSGVRRNLGEMLRRYRDHKQVLANH